MQLLMTLGATPAPRTPAPLTSRARTPDRLPPCTLGLGGRTRTCGFRAPNAVVYLADVHPGGRSRRIRTSDFAAPNRALCLTELHSVGASYGNRTRSSALTGQYATIIPTRLGQPARA